MKKLYEEEDIQKLANSIRSKTYDDGKMKVSEMATAIDGIDLERNLIKYIQGELTEIRFDGTAVGDGLPFNTNQNVTVIILTASSVATIKYSTEFDKCTSLVGIYVPDDLVDSYKTATNWVIYADKIKPMGVRPAEIGGSYTMKKLYEEESIKAVADSIRCKTGSSDKLKLADMSSKIDGIDLETYQKIIDRTITEVNLPNLTSVGTYGFRNCTALTEVNLPNLTSVGTYGFSNCTALTEVNLPNLTSIGLCGFYSCISLTEVNLPNLTNVGQYGFYSCTKLVKLVMPNVETINGSAFNYMGYGIIDDSINSILDFGSKLKSIESTSQTYNSWVKHIVIRTTTVPDGFDRPVIQAPRLYGFTKDYSGSRKADGWFYCPKASITAYSSALYISSSVDGRSRMRALEDYTVFPR